MEYELLIQDNKTGKTFDVTTLSGTIEHFTKLSGSAGKLSFLLQQDPNGLLQLHNGSRVSFKVDGTGVFFGYITTLGTDATNTYKVTAYDATFYLKNEEVMVTKNMRLQDIFKKVCVDFGLPYRVDAESNYVLPTYLHDGTTLFNILDYGIQRANINDKRQYFIRDDFGKIVLTELSLNKTNMILGDKSLVSDYKYELSIEGETANIIKLYRDNTKTKKRDVWYSYDSNNVKKWGNLQFAEKVDEDLNESQIKELAKNYLKVKNKEKKTMKVEALGIKELTAGRGFKLELSKLNIKEDMWITSATHKYSKNSHTMSLEVYI